MKISEIAEELDRIREERGDVEAELPDSVEPGWYYLVDRVEYDNQRERVLFVSDR